MPNIVAYLALISWPIVVFGIFQLLPPTRALICSIFAGYLLLPHGVAIDIPALPPLDKTFVSAWSAAVMSVLAGTRRSSTRRGQPNPALSPSGRLQSAGERQLGGELGGSKRSFQWIANGLLVVILFSPLVTALQNTDSYYVGPRLMPGLQLYDGMVMGTAALTTIVPYLLARRFLATSQDHLLLLQSLCIAGAIYAVPALVEVRLSPQFSTWVYGFLSQEFFQAIRGGSYRPVVFLQHGLWLALFLAMAALSAFALWRQRARRGSWLLVSLWLLITLALCNSLGALAILLALLPIVLLSSIGSQLIVALGVASVFLGYPLLRSADVFPREQVLSVVEWVSEERALSLDYRFSNEELLLERANERVLFGWGGWGRPRVFDTITGDDLTVTDGAWIIVLGTSGWVGYGATFGLILFPVALLFARRRQLDITLATSSLCLVLTANVADMIANGTLTTVTWLIAGALMGRAEMDKRPQSTQTELRSADTPAMGYARPRNFSRS